MPLPYSTVAHALLCEHQCTQAAMSRPRRLCPPLLTPSTHAVLLTRPDLIPPRSPFFLSLPPLRFAAHTARHARALELAATPFVLAAAFGRRPS